MTDLLSRTTSERVEAPRWEPIDTGEQCLGRYVEIRNNVNDAIERAQARGYTANRIRLPKEIYPSGSISAYLGAARIRGALAPEEYDELIATYNDAVAELPGRTTRTPAAIATVAVGYAVRPPDARELAANDRY